MKSLLLAPLPLLIVVTLLLLASLPWGGPDWVELTLAMLPIAAIYFWSARRPALMPAPLVFLSGLFADVATHQPLGLWTSAALVAAFCGRLTHAARRDTNIAGSASRAFTMLLLVVLLVGLVTSVVDWRLAPWRPLAETLLAAAICYPVLAGVLGMIDALWPVLRPDLWPVSDTRHQLLRGD